MKEVYLPLAEKIKNFNISLTEADILNFLKIKRRWPIRYPSGQPGVEIITNNGDMRNELFFEASGYIDYKKWKHFYDLGYTTIISNVLDLTEELRNLSHLIKDHVGNDINANFYFGKPGQKPSFDLHTHHYHVIVKQIYGAAEWICGDKKLILKPGETLWIPKEAPHAVVSKEEAKLSLTLNCE